MKISKIAGSRNWFLVNRKPIKCPICSKKEIKPALWGLPSPEAFKKFYIVGCEPDFPTPRDWGCCNCNAAFFKESDQVIQSFKECDLRQLDT